MVELDALLGGLAAEFFVEVDFYFGVGVFILLFLSVALAKLAGVPGKLFYVRSSSLSILLAFCRQFYMDLGSAAAF